MYYFVYFDYDNAIDMLNINLIICLNNLGILNVIFIFDQIEPRSYLTGVTTAKLWWHLSNMNEV